jgi:hypothetical protein
MAVEFKAKPSRTSEYRFFPEDIVVKPSLNGRYEKPDIEALIQDILVNGQHTPVVIRNDGGNAVLCAGYSRYRAVSEINKRKLLDAPLALRCTYTQCTEAGGFLAAISENRVRNTTTELDDAHNIARLMKVYAKTEDEVAAIYFPGVIAESSNGNGLDSLKKARAWVRKRLALVNLTPEAEQAMRDGTLKGSAAVAVAKLDQENQKAALKAKRGPKAKVEKKPSWKAQVIEVISAGMTPKGEILSDDTLDWLRSLVQ